MAEMGPGLRRDGLAGSGGSSLAGPLGAAPVGRAVRPVFEDDALRRQFGADAVGVGKTVLFAGQSAGSDTLFDRPSIDAAVKPIRRPLSKQTE